MRFFRWVVAQYVWPVSLVDSDLRKEWDNVDILMLETYELQSEYDNCLHVLRDSITFRLRYAYSCRVAAILNEAKRRGFSLTE